MYKDKHFIASFSLATLVLLVLVFVEIVDSKSIVIVSVTTILAFSFYDFLAKREFSRLKGEVYSVVDKIKERLKRVENHGIRSTAFSLHKQYQRVLEECFSGKVDYKASSAKLRLIRSQLLKINKLHKILFTFDQEIKSKTEIIEKSDKLKRRNALSCLRKMRQCRSIANKIVTKMDNRRMCMMLHLEDKFYSYMNRINIIRALG